MQAAVDPSTGKIDVSILTTGISGAVRKQRANRAQTLIELIKTKGKVLVLKYNKLYEEFREKVIEKGEQVCIMILCPFFNFKFVFRWFMPLQAVFSAAWSRLCSARPGAGALCFHLVLSSVISCYILYFTFYGAETFDLDMFGAVTLLVGSSDP